MITVVAKHGKRNYKDILSNGFLTIYIVLSMSCVWLAKETFDTATMLLTFICAWSCDTFVIFYRQILGKHKLIPQSAQIKRLKALSVVCRCNGYMYCISIDCEKCI